MEHFEKDPIDSFRYKLWFRYIDVTFVTFSQRKNTSDTFVNHLDSINKNTRFTMDIMEVRHV